MYRGFDIANHSLSHPHLTKVTDAQLHREIRDARDQLEQLFATPIHGFVYPFGDHDQRVMDAVRGAGHTYARTCNNAADIMATADRMTQPSSRFHQAADFWDEFERVRARDGVFYFWGHSYEFVSEADWAVFESILVRINATPNTQWVRLPELFT